MSSTPKCPVCRLPQRTSGLLTHLAEHSAQVLAEELLKALDEIVKTHRALNEARQLCRKHRFPSEEAALQALLKGWASRSPRRREIRAYKCDQCPDPTYHLTSRPLLADLDREVAS